MPNITRRDFLNGIALLGAASTLKPTSALAASDAPYPPALTGLRGSQPGSFELAHNLAWAGQRDFGPLAAAPEQYDLIVIGAGISGLSAAHFYRSQIKADARILLLDNHDDFGGHARRNEFTVDGQRYLSYGGTQSFDTPSAYSKEALALLKELGISLTRLEDAYDMDFFGQHQLTAGVFYDAADYGRHALIKSSPPTQGQAARDIRQWLPGLQTPPAFRDTLATAPLTPAQRNKLREVLAGSKKAVAHFSGDAGEKRFYQGRYVAFLQTVYQVRDPALLKLLSMSLAEEAALGGNGISLPLAQEGGLPGLPDGKTLARLLDDDSLLPDDEDDEGDAYVYHFPDGNATLARLLARRLIPSLASFSSPETCLTARFDYSRLDQPGQPVRLRLSSLAVKADNVGNGTAVQYVNQGKLLEARARHTVMAGWHMMAAHIIPSLGAEQKAAMRANIKMPLLTVQVALRRWHAIKQSGVAAAYCPGSYFQFVQMDFPVSMGNYQPDRSPDKPITLFLSRMPCPPLADGSVEDLLRQGRADILGTDFATYETHIRQQLAAMYGPYGFDAERDIAAITVNRWPHGYTYEDAMYKGRPAWQLASKRHGRIAIANADATGRAYTDAAIDAAWRAVQELKRV